MMSVCLFSHPPPKSAPVLPEEDPYITGGKPRYQIGDIVRVNCTSGRSKPAVHLAWHINGEQADGSLVKRYEPVVSGPDKLETSILGLEFRVKPKHFKRGDMKLKVRGPGWRGWRDKKNV